MFECTNGLVFHQPPLHDYHIDGKVFVDVITQLYRLVVGFVLLFAGVASFAITCVKYNIMHLMKVYQRF